MKGEGGVRVLSEKERTVPNVGLFFSKIIIHNYHMLLNLFLIRQDKWNEILVFLVVWVCWSEKKKVLPICFVCLFFSLSLLSFKTVR